MFLADQAQDIHLIYLENDFITVNGPNLLAFDSGIDWDIKRVEGASSMMGGGLFNMALNGTGWVAILSDGPPVLLNVASAPTFADAQAAITWSSGVTTAIKTDFKMKNLVGRGSGESVQMAFSGQGWVLVQPSEGQIAAAAPAAELERRRPGRPAQLVTGPGDLDDHQVLGVGVVDGDLARRAPPAGLQQAAAGVVAVGLAARRARPSRPAAATRPRARDPPRDSS